MIKLFEEFINKDYKTWKRKNVTIRGMREMGKENGSMALFGVGLYTAFLSNTQQAKKYGDLYFVVNAIPKHPLIVRDVNYAEMAIQDIISKWCNSKNIKYDSRKFYEQTTIEDEMQKLGYDGLIIKGREMVNYNPKDIKYFRTEEELEEYHLNNVKYN